MSTRYFTSDLHFGSTCINKVAHRPFVSAEDAVIRLINSINVNCDKYDTLIHVGDFMLSGTDRHGKLVDVGLDYDRDYYISKINPRITLIAGNHDSGHNCMADCNCMLLDLPRYKGVTVGHYPSHTNETGEIKDGISRKHTAGYLGNYGDNRKIHIHLCGHVHQAWLVYYDHANRVLNINVGVDQWNYNPVSTFEITDLLDYIFHRSYEPFHFKKDWHLNRQTYDLIVHNDKIARANAAKRRKAEKDAKKGLTPEERERRKIAAMKAKGLIK